MIARLSAPRSSPLRGLLCALLLGTVPARAETFFNPAAPPKAYADAAQDELRAIAHESMAALRILFKASGYYAYRGEGTGFLLQAGRLTPADIRTKKPYTDQNKDWGVTPTAGLDTIGEVVDETNRNLKALGFKTRIDAKENFACGPTSVAVANMTLELFEKRYKRKPHYYAYSFGFSYSTTYDPEGIWPFANTDKPQSGNGEHTYLVLLPLDPGSVLKKAVYVHPGKWAKYLEKDLPATFGDKPPLGGTFNPKVVGSFRFFDPLMVESPYVLPEYETSGRGIKVGSDRQAGYYPFYPDPPAKACPLAMSKSCLRCDYETPKGSKTWIERGRVPAAYTTDRTALLEWIDIECPAYLPPRKDDWKRTRWTLKLCD